jgi:enamine deaminase RidA (YjgF/YER057c/UK114 family)
MLVVIAGQVGVAPDGTLADGFEAQCAQAFANVGAALAAAGASWSNVIQAMTFLTRREDVQQLREWRLREFAQLLPDGRYPPNTLLVVSGLASEEMLIEVQVIAAV